ncbi:hypothetical protein JAAARDRAFT_211925 [Jaapia argillacea MUCL 33604]|uniref:ubiquitinyl hydrolase 1 n=1 Tax=Jaapia argillacea MUCL 33604 TaxID=933084 RepID=A0A067P8F6_9AGAM|nr:hypothetical protein JAAARDRAFT_211925 [Jaapia argillacea MUCL 33604]
MASPQPPYSHPGPSYYPHQQPPPPPQHYYANPPHSAPHQVPYPYHQYPPPPGPPPHHHMPPIHTGQGPSHRGRGYARGGGPPYHGYHHHHPAQPPYIPSPTHSHSPVHTTSPSIPPASPFHPQKYPTIPPHQHHLQYSPPFLIHPQPNGAAGYPSPNGVGQYSPANGVLPPPPHTSAWSTVPMEDQTTTVSISPLPKQLSMPPPSMSSPSQVDEFLPPSTEIDEKSSHALVEPQQSSSQPTSPPPELAPSPPPPEIASSPQPNPSLPQSAPSPIPPSFIPSFSTLSTLSSPSSPSSHPSSSRPSPEVRGWAIWSKRPTNPSLAPGIIISPRARPPQAVRRNAIELPTPPASPILPSTVPLTLGGGKVEEEHIMQAIDQVAHPPIRDVSPPHLENETTPATSTAPDTPMPGSPLSSTTSISAAATSPGRSKGVEKLPAENPMVEPAAAPVVEPTAPAVEATTAPAVGSTTTQTVDPTTAQTVDLTTAPAVDPTTTQTADPTGVAPTQPSSSSPASAPTKPMTKSWASLLRPSGGGSSPAGSSKLPTSSVVGFSIPADQSPAPPPVVDVPNRAELVALLVKGPGSGVGVGGAAGRIKPRGLVNSGNMCFANAVLQVLVYCVPFGRLFGELGRLGVGSAVTTTGDGKGEKRRESEVPLVDATIRFLNEFVVDDGKGGQGGKGKERERYSGYEDEEEDGGLDSFVPSYVYDAMKEKKRFENMRGGHQEDAEEFFGFYLDTLEEELLHLLNSLSPPPPPSSNKPGVVVEKVEEEVKSKDDGWMEVGKRNRMVVTRTIKTTESPITKIFGGKFRSTLRAPHQRDSVLVEDWRSIRLDIQREHIHTITDALQYISHPQPVQVTSPIRPGVIIDASQQVLIDTLPPILVLHLKRFHYDVGVGGAVKIGKQISFGPELEIPAEIMSPAKKSSHPPRYKLFGVLYHHGLSASGGHYTIDILHPNRDQSLHKPREGWIRIDDELVSDVRTEDVFGAWERDDRCAYLLVYRRMGWGSRT